MEDHIHFLRLWDLYSPLLTPIQQEITNMYFNYDLSLTEIAEQKGVSRQSVSDCLQKCKNQLEINDQKLGFDKMQTDLSREYSAYMTTVLRWRKAQKELHPEWTKELDELEEQLHHVHTEFKSEIIVEE